MPGVAPGAGRWTPLLPTVASAYAAFAILHRSRGAPRAPWLLMGLALAASFVGWAFTSIRSLRGADPGLVEPFAEAAYFLAYLLFIAGLGAFLLGTSPQDRLRRSLDVLALTCTLAAIAWVLVLRGLVHASGLPTLQGLTIVAYPALDLALVAAFLLLATEAHRGTRAPLALLAAAGLALFLGDVAYAWVSLDGQAPVGAAADVAWMACYVFVALAARYRAPADETLAAPHPQLAMAMQFAPMLALLPLAVADYTERRTLDAVLFGLGVAMVSALTVRQALMFSDLRRSTAALRRSTDDLVRQKMDLTRGETKFRTLAENFPDYITRVDREGRRIYTNPAMQRLWASLGAGDPTGTKVTEAFVTKPAAAQDLQAALTASLADGRRRTLHQAVETPQGQRHLDYAVVPERGPEGQVESALLVARDVTETQDAYAALRASEERYRLLAENASDLVQLFDANGVCQYASPSSVTVLGYTPDELVGHDGHHLLDPRDAAALRAGHLAIPRPDGSLVTEARAHRKDGTVVWVETVTRPRLGPDGKPTGFVSSTRDITARRLAEERFQLVSRATTDVIWDYEVAAGRLTWGESMEEVFGHRLADLAPGLDSWSRLVHPDDHGAVTASFAAALAGPATKWNGAYRFRRADGQWADVLDRCFILRDAAGRAVRAVGSFSDISDLRRAEREREAAMRHAEDERREAQRLKEMAGFKTQFLRNAAHELATPLTPLRLQLATFAPHLSKIDPAGFGLLQRNVERLGTLANDLLDAARLQSGHVRITPKRVALADVLGRVAASFRAQAQAAGLTLGVHPCAAGLVVECDETRLEQVLFNLVHNAIKFTPRGGQVWLGQEPDGRFAAITVQDTGIGLAPEQAARLFEPFTQVHDATHVKVGGTGLGLYIARGLVEQQGGSLDVHSAGPGAGARFTIRLPLTRPGDGAAPRETVPAPPRAGGARASP